jgi:hypothetical protein
MLSKFRMYSWNLSPSQVKGESTVKFLKTLVRKRQSKNGPLFDTRKRKEIQSNFK